MVPQPETRRTRSTAQPLLKTPPIHIISLILARTIKFIANTRITHKVETTTRLQKQTDFLIQFTATITASATTASCKSKAAKLFECNSNFDVACKKFKY